MPPVGDCVQSLEPCEFRQKLRRQQKQKTESKTASFQLRRQAPGVVAAPNKEIAAQAESHHEVDRSHEYEKAGGDHGQLTNVYPRNHDHRYRTGLAST